MPRSCSVCSNGATAEIAKAIAAGGSNREVAVRFGVTESAIQRHRVNCLRAPRRAKDSGTGPAGGTGAVPVRFDSSAKGELEPKALLRRAEWLLDDAQSILTRASAGNDDRLALSAVREVRSSLELVMKAHGMLSPENAVSVNVVVDQRRQAAALLSKFSEDELRAIARGQPIGEGGAHKVGTEFRDQKSLAPS